MYAQDAPTMVGTMILFIRHFNSKLFSRKARISLKNYSKNSNKDNIHEINYFSISLKNQINYGKNILFFSIKRFSKSFFLMLKRNFFT